MKFKTDENLPVEVKTVLREAGHDAESVADEGLCGSPDPPVLEHAKREARVLFTMDKGIANIRRYPPEDYAGIVLFRPPTSGRIAVTHFVRDHLADVVRVARAGRLLVVTDRGIRMR